MAEDIRFSKKAATLTHVRIPTIPAVYSDLIPATIPK